MYKRYLVLLSLVVAAVSARVLLGTPATPVPAGTATVTGKVTYTGTPPKMKPIDMSKEPVCAKEHNPPDKTQTVVTGDTDALKWVVVYISAGDHGGSTPTQPVRFDQKGCMYMPHILAMQVDQPLRFIPTIRWLTIFTPCRNRTRNGTNPSRQVRLPSRPNGTSRNSFRSNAIFIPGCMATSPC